MMGNNFIKNRQRLLIVAFLLPAMAWLVVIYLGSLANLLQNSFFYFDEMTEKIVRDYGFISFAKLFTMANLRVILRTLTMAAVVTVAAAVVAFPLAWYMARLAKGWSKFLVFFAVMMPLWSSYLVKLYVWKMMLAKEGVISYLAAHVGLAGVLDWLLTLPIIGGNSLSYSTLGRFLVFLYMWLPYMVLPVAAALERVPTSLLESAVDLGASEWQKFRTVVIPLAMPGIAAGSIFTFSLTLGDYIIPQVIGDSSPFIGLVIYQAQGNGSDLPFAAVFTLVPIVILVIYLMIVRRMGAFDAV
ncbi:MAG: ABC transporter permease [Candidatus Pacebacteria bacterium]|nr:ABC transporter permease [Candidatus Paceibacterota bacterium]